MGFYEGLFSRFLFWKFFLDDFVVYCFFHCIVNFKMCCMRGHLSKEILLNLVELFFRNSRIFDF